MRYTRPWTNLIPLLCAVLKGEVTQLLPHKCSNAAGEVFATLGSNEEKNCLPNMVGGNVWNVYLAWQARAGGGSCWCRAGGPSGPPTPRYPSSASPSSSPHPSPQPAWGRKPGSFFSSLSCQSFCSKKSSSFVSLEPKCFSNNQSYNKQQLQGGNVKRHTAKWTLSLKLWLMSKVKRHTAGDEKAKSKVRNRQIAKLQQLLIASAQLQGVPQHWTPENLAKCQAMSWDTL